MRATFAVLLLVCLGCGGNQPPKVAKASFKPNKETTYITEPVDADGYLDYESALNERLRGKITPVTNANVLLWQAMGPKPEGKEPHADYWKWLQAERPADGRKYFVGRQFFLTSRGVEGSGDAFNERDGRLNARPWTAKDEPDFAAWLEANERPLALVEKASQRAEYYYPLVPRNEDGSRGVLIDSPLPSLQKVREVADALVKRAMLNIGEGKFDEAWRDLLTLHRLGRLVGKGGTLIEQLIGFAFDGMACRADITFLGRANLTSKQAQQYGAELHKLLPMPNLADKVDLCERLTILDIIQFTHKYGFDSLGKTGTGKPPVAPDAATQALLRQLDWDTIFSTANPTFDRAVGALKQPDRASRLREWGKVESDLREQRRQLGDNTDVRKAIQDGGPIDKVASEKVGKILITLLFPAVNKVLPSPDRLVQNHRNLQLAFALAAYRSDNGKYPPNLADLVPKYVAMVAPDLYSGKPLIYKPTGAGYLLYSVGENGEDDGGATYGDDPPGNDLVVRMK